MLGKLIKYEFKSTMRSFLTIYASLLLTGLLIGIFMVAEVEVGTTLSMFILLGLIVALAVLTIVMIIKRFNKNLLGDEGYLMMTLPVSTKKIIASKVITGTVYMMLSLVVVILAFVIIMLPSGNVITELINSIGNIWDYMIANLVSVKEIMQNILMTLIAGIVSDVYFILTIYISLSIGQLKPFNNHRIPAAVVAFFVLNTVVSTLGNWMTSVIPANLSMEALSMCAIGFYAVVSVVLFMATSYILENKLNLE